ncbi:MAG: glycosyltransferase, partial [Calditrichaeota bacterium]|nr:glycosyltransferase [Calditrichota bacterium]
MTTASQPAISIIIPVYRGGDKFERSYLSAIAALSPGDELIIVIDGDPAGTPLPKASNYLRIYQTPTRSGPAAARNLGAKYASGDVLFFVDADVAIPQTALAAIRDVFSQNPEISALIGSYDDAPSEKNFLSQYRNLLHHFVHQNASADASTFWGACGAVQKDVFLQSGGFDETLYDQPAIEDIEFGYRLKAAGYRIRLEKTLQVKHLKRWTATSIITTDLFQRAVPWTELILQNNHLLNDLNTDSKSRISIVLSFLLIIFGLLSFALPMLSILAGSVAALLLLINQKVYRFFRQKRGFWFALRVVPWHWLYFLISGTGFAIGLLKHLSKKKKKVTAPATLRLRSGSG